MEREKERDDHQRSLSLSLLLPLRRFWSGCKESERERERKGKMNGHTRDQAPTKRTPLQINVPPMLARERWKKGSAKWFVVLLSCRKTGASLLLLLLLLWPKRIRFTFCVIDLLLSIILP